MQASPRYLRFVRALALASGASAVSCDGSALYIVGSDAGSGAAHDAAYDATLEIDAGDATVDAQLDSRIGASEVQTGACRSLTLDAAQDLKCGEGFSCSFPDDSDAPRCTYGVDAAGDASENQECGVVLCAEYCYCAGAAASVCGCFHGPTGPLSPPDLSRVMLHAHGGPLPSLRARPRARLGRRRRRM